VTPSSIIKNILKINKILIPKKENKKDNVVEKDITKEDILII
jgi:hypothetical protein